MSPISIYLTRRIAVVVIGATLALTVSGLTHLRQTPSLKIAKGMLGETWYRIQLAGQHVGYMYNNAYLDYLGRWHFQTNTHFLLQPEAPNTIAKHLVFDGIAPHAMVSADFTNRDQATHAHTRVARTSSGLVATLSRNTTTGDAIPLDWDYDLLEFLGFEHWLATQRPVADEKFTVSSADFERLRIIPQSYRVVARRPEGYLVEVNAPLAATRTQLNHAFRPLWLNMAGVFEVTASNQSEAIALQELRYKTNYLVPADQRLTNHTSLKSLHLRIVGAPRIDLPRNLQLSANPITSGTEIDQYRGEALRYPVTDHAIQKLAQQALSQSRNEPSTGNLGDTDPLLEQLVRLTHKQLRYSEDDPAGSVLQALEKGRGECTDYADLLTTVARAAGLPARTIYGLAYKDGSNPAFMFHAWNEVFANGEWQALDPTWAQVRVDATHIPLTDIEAARLMMANNTEGLQIKILDAQYF